MISRQRWIRALLVLMTVEAALVADPIRPWLPFSLWTLSVESVTAAGLLAFAGMILVGVFVPYHFPGLRPLPMTFPLIGACLLLYGLPPAAGIAVLTVLLARWRDDARYPEEDPPRNRVPLAPTLAGIGIGLLLADISGYFLPEPPLTREAFGFSAVLGTGVLLAMGAAAAALTARHFAGVASAKEESGARLPGTLMGAAGTAALALAAAQAVRVWGLGPVALVLAAPFTAMAPVALVLSIERRALALAQARSRGLTDVLEALALAIEARDRVSAHHLSRMRIIAAGIGRRLGLSGEELEALDLATLLHDIGKLAVPEWVLSKPGSLTEEEYQKMTVHSETASRILGTVPFSRSAAPIVKHHHEHFDGSGYPDGLAGLEIPIGARILAVVDAMDSIMSERAYHHALGATQALAYIQVKSGSLFDPRVVKALTENYNALAEEVEAKSRSAAPPAQERSARPTPVEAKPQGAPGEMQAVLDGIASSHMEVYSLHEIGQALGKTLNVEESLSLIAGRLNSLFHYSACAVYVLDRERRMLVPRLTAGRAAEALKRLEIPVGGGLSGWAAAEKRSILSAPPAEPILRGAMRSDFDGIEDASEVADLVCCMAAPLISGLEVVGVIALYDTASAPYAPAEERLLGTVGRQVGAAIRTAILFERTQEHTLTDFLTGLPNARYMFAMAEQEIARARETGEPFSILILNLDGFAALNEDYGHPAGDRYLIGVSKVIRSQMRDPDTCVRYSGDEFVAILPGVGREEAIQVAERVEKAVAEFTVDVRSRKQVSLTISAGHATHSLDGPELEELMRAAQERLSRRKVSKRSDAASSTLITFRRSDESSSN